MKKLSLLIVLILVLVYFPIPASRKATPEFDIKTLKFPKDFFWGASTASHQVEGGNYNNWTEWEKVNAERLAREAAMKFSDIPEAGSPANYISEDAVDHYRRYPEDIQIIKSLGLTAYRFSIEWSRIEPEKNRFDQKELEHYRQVIKALKAAGIEPFVTLWHRTNPIWVSAQGEWENPQTVEDFLNYADKVTTELGSDVKYWMTFNEPTFHIATGYIGGDIPPEVKSYRRGVKAQENMIEAHRQVYQLIHKKDATDLVGSTHAIGLAEGQPNSLINYLIARYLKRRGNYDFLDRTVDETDFIGMQYYSIWYFALRWGGKSFSFIESRTSGKNRCRGSYGHGLGNLSGRNLRFNQGNLSPLSQTDHHY